jgi:hypothetical protein
MKATEQRKLLNKLKLSIDNESVLRQIIRQIKYIIEGEEVGESPFFIIKKIKNIIEQETQT